MKWNDRFLIFVVGLLFHQVSFGTSMASVNPPGSWNNPCLMVENLEAQAKTGDKDAQFALGQLHITLPGGPEQSAEEICVTRDSQQAVHWFSKAATAGHEHAGSLLGLMYQNGWGVAKNLTESEKWWEFVALRGNPTGMVSLAKLYLKGTGKAPRITEAIKWFEKAYENGAVEAAFELSELYSRGLGVKEDQTVAVAWLEKAMKGGWTEAYFKLGIRQVEGHGVPKNEQAGLTLIQQAARWGVPGALMWWGKAHLTGIHVQKNEVEGKNFLDRAFLGFMVGGLVNEAKTLIEEGLADPNALGTRPVHIPTQEEMMEAARTGKMPEVEQVPVLGLAAEAGHAQMVSLLLKNGADVNAKRTKTRKTPLWSAAEYGYPKIVELLLKAGADPNFAAHDKDSGDQTPLEVARNKGHQPVISLLEAVNAKGESRRPRSLLDPMIETVEVEYRILETDARLSPQQVTSRHVRTPLPDRTQVLAEQAKMIEPSSPWLQAEKSRYQDLLGHGPYDVLLVPVQVQHFGIDAIGRSLMTHYVVEGLRQTTRLRIPNPWFVQKALGEHSRTYQPEEVYRLANALGVMKVVWLFAGHDRTHEMRVTVQVQTRDQSGLHSASKIVQWDTGLIPFSDSHPPEEVFQSIVERIIKRISPAAKSLPRPVHTTNKQRSFVLPPSLKELVNQRSISAEVDAYHLQLLGALFPFRTERAREHLFERSLVALAKVPLQSPEYSIIKARALLYLHRRPAALAALENNRSAEGNALRAALNGNLPRLEQEMEKIKDPIKRLLAEFEWEDLRSEYQEDGNNRERLKAVAAQYPGWEELILRRLDDLDLWQQQSNEKVKGMLDEFFPIPGTSIKDVIRKELLFKGQEPMDTHWTFLPLAHVQELLRTDPARWCCEKELGRPQEIDVVTLLASLAESNLHNSLFFELNVQGNVTAAKNTLDHYRVNYEGHPIMSAIQARTTFDLSLLPFSGPTSPVQVQESYVRDGTQALWGAGGQTWFAGKLLWESFDAYWKFNEAGIPLSSRFLEWCQWYSEDVPRRDFWPSFESPLRAMDPKYDENLISALRYTMTNLSLLKSLYERSPTQMPAKIVWEQNQHRFDGHPDRLDLIAQVKNIAPDSSEMEKIYLVEINKKVGHWKPYREVGARYVKQGRYQEAQHIFQQYPGFQGPPGQNRVALSNHAQLAGSYLFWRGAYAEAEHFYRISADLQTGSDSSLTSAARIAMVNGEYIKSAKIFLARATRYNSHYAYRDYLSLLHVLGFSNQAWEGFSGLLGKFDHPQIWTSAFVGHRIEGATRDQITRWIKEQQKKRSPHAFRSFPARYAFLTHAVDRKPDETMIPLIAELEKGYEARVTSSGSVMNKANQWIGPSNYNGTKNRFRKINHIPESELVLFAKGYQAIQKQDYRSAMQWFEERALFYTYHYEDYGGYALPYFAWASVKSGQTTAMKEFLKNYERPDDSRTFQKEFDFYLAEAFMAGGEGRHEEAVASLNAAFNRRPHTEMRPIFSWYQIVEACEWLYEDSNQEVYKILAVKWAKAYQIIQPMFAWAYAVEAKYSTNALDRRRALGFALHLDRHSERISGIRAAEKVTAREWFEKNNPFVIKETPTKSAA